MSQWLTRAGATTLILGADVAPTAKNLSNNAGKLSDAYDNTAVDKKFQFADFELQCRGQAAFNSGGKVKCWFIVAADGSNYEDGGDSVTPGRDPDWEFTVRAVDTPQRIAEVGVVLPSSPFKVLIVNEAGQAFTNTDAENLLRMIPYNETAR